MLYFVLKNDRKLGPFTESQLQELLSAGLISATDRAWKVEESEGTPLDQMFAGEQNTAEDELDTVHDSPIAVSQGMRQQELETVGVPSHPAHQWDDSVVGPDIPHTRGAGVPDVPNWPSERAPLNLDMDMDRLSSVDTILPLRVAIDYQERPFANVLSDDEPLTAVGVDAVVENAPFTDTVTETQAFIQPATPETVAMDVILQQDAAADFLVTIEFPLTPMSAVDDANVADVCAEGVVAEVVEESSLEVAAVTPELIVVPVAQPVTDVNHIPAAVEVAVEPVAIAQPQPIPAVAPVLETVVPVGLEAFFSTDAPVESTPVPVASSTALVQVVAEVQHPVVVPEPAQHVVAVEAITAPAAVVPVAAPALQHPVVDSSFSGFQPAATLSQHHVTPAQSIPTERRTAAERSAEDVEINNVCSRIEARLAERRMRLSNVRVVPTGGIAVFGGLLYAIPLMTLATYGFAIQIATAGTFKITAGVVPYLVEAAAALLFHAYGVVVGHKVLTGDQKGRIYAERHLELRRFILPAIWMTLFFIAGPVPMALPGLPVSSDAASQLTLSPFQLRIFYMVVLEQIFCGAWDIYFRRSKRVAETYTFEPYV
jgi:hypothetical protein